tara:strand:+ start:134 stop:580 length:447 start_codon:yes stop_codon:yes gene_type:complete
MSKYKISKKRLAEIIKEEYQSLQHRKTRRLNEDANDDTFEMVDTLQMILGPEQALEDIVQAMERSQAHKILKYVMRMREIPEPGDELANRQDEKMDPVGKEDGDIDNDGDEDSSDEYLKNRREKVGKAIKKESLRSIRSLIQQELKNL